MREELDLKPFHVAIPDPDIEDLLDRLRRTRWSDEPSWLTGDYGVTVKRLQRLVEYWISDFDWREQECAINAYPQFTTTIDGQNIHFVHVRSTESGALPVILTHGWPGSILEYLDLVSPLSDPRSFGFDPSMAFDVVIPSLPGFGFSGPTTEPSWGTNRTAAAWAQLMSRLGYERFGAIGNDAGSMISPEIGRLHPDRVVGVHVTQLFSFPSGDPSEMVDLSPDEATAMDTLRWFWEQKGAFNTLHSQQPQTLSHSLADSPAGLLGWHDQLLGEGLDDDFVIANTAIYWLTGTAGSAIRFYFANAHNRTSPPATPTTVPTALASATDGDFKSIRRFADRDHSNIVSWNTIDAVGHYTAHTATDLLTRDIQLFFSSLR